jgi:hypothetical protein
MSVARLAFDPNSGSTGIGGFTTGGSGICGVPGNGSVGGLALSAKDFVAAIIAKKTKMPTLWLALTFSP